MEHPQFSPWYIFFINHNLSVWLHNFYLYQKYYDDNIFMVNKYCDDPEFASVMIDRILDNADRKN